MNKIFPASDKENELKNLRSETDKIDRKLVALINKRFYYSILIGRLKKRFGLSAYSPNREKEINLNITNSNEGPLDNVTLLRVYERLIDESRSLQNRIINQKKDLSDIETKEKIDFKKIIGRKEISVIAGFFIILVFIFYYTLFTKNSFDKQAPYKFEINYGESFNSVTERLYKEEIIPSKFNFKVAAFIYGAETRIRSARYYIPNNLSYLDLLDLFISGKADFLKTLRIFNGVSSEWIAGAVNRELKVDSASFMSLVKNKILIDSLGIKANSLEGYLLPGKYFIFEKSSPSEVIDILYSGMKSFLSDTIIQRIKQDGKTKHQVLTIASIVEGETEKAEEMPLIAGVYYNRLRIGMKLQADPTIQYLQTDGWKRLSYKDLKINSPYNTYLNFGLPPGPINNPGKDALLASVYPAQHNYLYFVADGTGGHKFAKNYSEHLNNVKAYRLWLKNHQN
jgi:UPF0755 protein